MSSGEVFPSLSLSLSLTCDFRSCGGWCLLCFNLLFFQQILLSFPNYVNFSEVHAIRLNLQIKLFLLMSSTYFPIYLFSPSHHIYARFKCLDRCLSFHYTLALIFSVFGSNHVNYPPILWFPQLLFFHSTSSQLKTFALKIILSQLVSQF